MMQTHLACAVLCAWFTGGSTLQLQASPPSQANSRVKQLQDHVLSYGKIVGTIPIKAGYSDHREHRVHFPVPFNPAFDQSAVDKFCDLFVSDGEEETAHYGGTEGSGSCRGFVFDAIQTFRGENKDAHNGSDLIESYFQHLKTTPSDINQHMGALRFFASQCQSVVELGTRGAVSTWAFLAGLRDKAKSQSKKKAARARLISSDLSYHRNIETVRLAAKHSNISYGFVLGDSTEIPIVSSDLLFIDTWHVYAQIKRELTLHSNGTKKFIIMHDTTIDEWEGQSVRNNWDTRNQARVTGFPEPEIRKGIWPAIQEFLDHHPEWQLLQRWKKNNGLTVLSKR